MKNPSELIERLSSEVAQKIANAVDFEVLYSALEWTMVDVPFDRWDVEQEQAIINWCQQTLAEGNWAYNNNYRLAFKKQRDASMFILRWS